MFKKLRIWQQASVIYLLFMNFLFCLTWDFCFFHYLPGKKVDVRLSCNSSNMRRTTKILICSCFNNNWSVMRWSCLLFETHLLSSLPRLAVDYCCSLYPYKKRFVQLGNYFFVIWTSALYIFSKMLWKLYLTQWRNGENT